MTALLGTVIAGSKMIATGQFTGGSDTQILWQGPNGTYFLTLTSSNGSYQTLQVGLPAGYSVVGVGNGGIPSSATNTILNPASSELMLEDAAGDLAYGSFYSSSAGSGFAASPIGRIAAGWAAVATGNYNIANYWGDGQVLLENIQGNIGTLVPFDSNLPAFNIPSGFTVVPDGTGNYFGSDLPGTLLYNSTNGTVEALLEGGTVVTQGHATSVAVTDLIGSLQPNETIVAVGTLNGDGSTDIILQQDATLYEWIIRQGTIAQTVTLALPAGFAVAGMADVDGGGTAAIVITDDAGDVEMIGGGTSTDLSQNAPFATASPAIVLDGNYDVVSGSGVNATLSDYLAELTSGVPLSATGVNVLTVQQGALSCCSYEQVVAGNITLAAWEQNVATLNAIAAECRSNGIVVQVETQLGWEGDFGAAQTYQWLNPALAAGLPIGYVEDNQEFPNWTSLNIPTMADAELQDIQVIHAALPDAVFGEWEIPGSPDSAGTVTAYHSFLQTWYATLNADAAQQGLPGLSYIIADQYFSPTLVAGSAVSETDQGAGADTSVNDVASLVKDAGAVGIRVEIQDSTDASDLNPLQALARQELEISQEATLGIAAIQLSGGFNQLPVSNALNVPGASYNGAAIAAAITPLYQSRSITTAGTVGLTLPAQVIVGQGHLAAIGGLSVGAGAADEANRLAVVLIDQTGTLSAASFGGATVGHDGPNTLILNGTPGDVAAELASLTINEAAAGPDSIDVEVFGSSGRVAGGTIDVLATQASGSMTFMPSAAGVLPQIWNAASAIVNNGVIVSESFAWNDSDGLNAASFIGGTTIAPIMDILVDQPLLQGTLLASGTATAYPAADLAWEAPDSWTVYGPLSANISGSLAPEGTPVVVASSNLTFDPVSGQLQTEADTLAPVPASAYASLPQFADASTPYYFANGGLAVTQYNTGDNPSWPSATAPGSGLYAGGAGALSVIASGSTLLVADGATNPLAVGSIQTIYGIVNGSTRVVEVRYLGAATDPYDEIDQIFNPYSATTQLWQQINTVGIPAAMAGTSPLPVSSATTVTEYNTGNNPNWSDTVWINPNQTISVIGDLAEAVTYEGGIWDSAATIAANGVADVYRGVTWSGEGAILNAYTLTAPTIQGWTAGGTSIQGTGIAGDWVVVTGGDGTVLGGSRIGADCTWQVSPAIGFGSPAGSAVTAQQFDLAGDSSVRSAPAWIVGGPSSEYIILDDGGSLFIQDTVSGGNGPQVLQDTSLMTFTDGVGVFDPTGSAEDVSRLYYAALDRAPDVGGLEAWTNDIDDGTMSLADVATDFATSPEFLQDYGASSNATFVTQLYSNVMGRAPDAAGLQFWKNALNAGWTRGAVLIQFAESQEYKADTISTAGDPDNAEIYRLYQTALDRAPDQDDLAGWTAMLANGVALGQIAQDFIGSAEFRQDYGSSSVAALVNDLYENGLHRAPAATELQVWVNALQAGETEASVLLGIADSPESRALSAPATHANWVFIPN